MDNLKTAVLISIRPKWCELIANREKTIEVRKTKPKLQTPFKCYIYCTQSELLTKSHYNARIYVASSQKYQKKLERMGNLTLSGKVIGEFICDEIIEDFSWGHNPIFKGKALMTDVDIAWYCLNNPMYLWHISELIIYDTPKELSDFGISRPPQSWCYVEEYKNEVYGLDGTVYTPNEDRTCWVGKQKEREQK